MEVEHDTNGVTRGINAKQPHHKGLVLTYPMKNEMPLVPHIGEQ